MEQFNQIKERAITAGCLDKVGLYEQLAKEISECTALNIAAIGEPNSGKTTLINRLAGAEVRAPSLLQAKEPPLFVTFTKGETKSGYETKYVHSPEKKRLGFNLHEIPINLAINSDTGEPSLLLESMDIILYVVSAITPLTIEDMRNLNAFANRLPCIVFISKLPILERAGERDEVIDFIERRYRENFGKGAIIPMDGKNNKVFDMFKEYIASVSVDDIRPFHILQLVSKCNGIIRETLNAKLEALKLKKEQEALKNTKGAEAQRQQQLIWGTLRVDMMEKKQKTQQKLADRVASGRKAIETRLIQPLESSKYSDEEYKKSPQKLTAELYSLSEAIKTEIEEQITYDVKWLVLEIERRLGRKIEVNELEFGEMTAFMRVPQHEAKKTAVKKTELAIGSGLIAGGAIAASLIMPEALVLAAPAVVATALLAKGSLDDKKRHSEEMKSSILDYCSKCCASLLTKLDSAVASHYKYVIQTLQSASSGAQQAEGSEGASRLALINKEEQEILAQLKLCEI